MQTRGDIYDSIGRTYRRARREDPRIAAQILEALDGCRSVVNVGAGTGSYEPVDREVVAIEPSIVMIRQRGADAAPVVRATAMNLPLRDASFDAAMAVLTIHHWPDFRRGLDELRRVARRRVVVLTFDTAVFDFWLSDYFPEIRDIDAHSMPSLAGVAECLTPCETFVVPVPHDCADGFLGAYWRRPEAYLDPDARSGISLFAKMRNVDAGVDALRRDLASGAWQARYAHLLQQTELDLGYRLIVGRLNR